MSERSAGATAAASLLAGLGGSLLAAVPALLRVVSGGDVALAAAALVGATSLVVVPLGLWLRQARQQGFGPSERALLCGAAMSAAPLALFGGVLKSTTHHRPLGGATFAVAALCLLALCVGLAFRVFAGARPNRPNEPVKSTWQNLFSLGCGLSLASVLLLAAARAGRPNLADFLALAVGSAVAALIPTARWGMAGVKARWVALGWVALLACAAVSLNRPQLVRSLTSQAPVSFAPLSWLGVGS